MQADNCCSVAVRILVQVPDELLTQRLYPNNATHHGCVFFVCRRKQILFHTKPSCQISLYFTLDTWWQQRSGSSRPGCLWKHNSCTIHIHNKRPLRSFCVWRICRRWRFVCELITDQNIALTNFFTAYKPSGMIFYRRVIQNTGYWEILLWVTMAYETYSVIQF